MRTTPALAGLLAMLALPCAAQAATLGTIPVDPDQQTSGTFQAPGTQKWSLSLKKGRRYAVWGWSGDHVTASVRAAGGATLARFTTIDDEGAHGASFRAPYTGLYTVVAACQTDQASPGQDCRTIYSLQR